MYHPAAALRSSEVERQSYDDAAGIPAALLEARRRREAVQAVQAGDVPEIPPAAASNPTEPAQDAPTLF